MGDHPGRDGRTRAETPVATSGAQLEISARHGLGGRGGSLERKENRDWTDGTVAQLFPFYLVGAGGTGLAQTSNHY